MKIFQSLAFKLFILIFILILGITGIFSTLIIRWQTQKCLQISMENALKTSDLIKRATHYSMLHNRRDDIYQIIKMLGQQPGIEVIRIYNKRGEITFSTIPHEVGKVMSVESEACNVCHRSGKITVPAEATQLTRIFHSTDGYEVLGAINPIKNEESCYNANCHAHKKEQTILGVFDVMISLKDMRRNIEKLTKIQYASGIAMLLIISIFVLIFIWKFVNIPLRKLTYGTREIMNGNLDFRLDLSSKDEIGLLAESFNKMTERLKQAHEELLNWAKTLEQKVNEKTAELQRAHAYMLQIEKMASLGKLSATVAHELNNPLEGILTYAKLLKRKLQNEKINEDEKEEILNELSIIIDETARCGNIVKNLLLFSKQKVGEFKDEDICQVIKRSVNLISHHLQMNNIKLELDIPENPVFIFCDAQQIEQMLIAMEINSIEAMPDGGTLKIELKEINSDKIQIKVIDTGVGIPEEILPHIFEPFFTTKKEGKGTGLGLAVVYGIVERHAGKISVESKVNHGTTFTVTLPKKPNINYDEKI
ncbi:sensor histidine kinase [Candidatus Kryptobacter tengchongensis]|uniref:sensor histidine kinase n=1 Tax=Kryptobacter tengchongensis TaxID=1643429 RepID=UPI000707D8A2|nr:HAMP domain-containing sensor histidine kinase [Candidatus Kryptobacter tengchongensis]CUS83227.1 two-component system, NtrC family, sensor kinase [Candidatus Kryptobacter tengchongensis]